MTINVNDSKQTVYVQFNIPQTHSNLTTTSQYINLWLSGRVQTSGVQSHTFTHQLTHTHVHAHTHQHTDTLKSPSAFH